MGQTISGIDCHATGNRLLKKLLADESFAVLDYRISAHYNGLMEVMAVKAAATETDG